MQNIIPPNRGLGVNRQRISSQSGTPISQVLSGKSVSPNTSSAPARVSEVLSRTPPETEYSAAPESASSPNPVEPKVASSGNQVLEDAKLLERYDDVNSYKDPSKVAEEQGWSDERLAKALYYRGSAEFQNAYGKGK